MLVSLLLMKMIVKASATYFQFNSWQFARRLAAEIQLLIRGAVCFIRAVISDFNMPYSLSHVYYFNILGGETFAYVVSTTRCINCPISS